MATVHRGYAGPERIRVVARVLLHPSGRPGRPIDVDRTERRGFRNFFTAEVAGLAATITIGGHRYVVETDRTGRIDVSLPNTGLAPGWHEVVVTPEGGAGSTGDVLVVAPDTTFGLISDIDDTVLATNVPRALLAGYNTFIRTEGSRRPVPGMADWYRAVTSAHPEAPVFYLSTGAWNTYGLLVRFLARHHYPTGPLLLTDWGPTQSGWFRSGRRHKAESLARLTQELPNVRWLLIGDDGQHDPSIYAEFTDAHPGRVRAIAIRQLTPAEQVRGHGTPGAREQVRPVEPVPQAWEPDGAGLAAALPDL